MAKRGRPVKPSPVILVKQDVATGKIIDGDQPDSFTDDWTGNSGQSSTSDYQAAKLPVLLPDDYRNEINRQRVKNSKALLDAVLNPKPKPFTPFKRRM